MSKVQEFVLNEAKRESSDVGRKFRDRRVTVRLNGGTYGRLKLIAAKIGDSPTGCAQSLLENAIEDAIQALGYKDSGEMWQEIIDLMDEEEDPANPEGDLRLEGAVA